MLPIIRNHICHLASAGSHRLKSVLPALVPEMTYDDLQVANRQMPDSLGNLSRVAAWIETIAKALLAYCGQNTLGWYGW